VCDLVKGQGQCDTLRTGAFVAFPRSLVSGLGAMVCWGGGIVAFCPLPNGGDGGPDRVIAVVVACCVRDVGGLSPTRPGTRLVGAVLAAAAVI
jgi:hypothetical protein